MTTTTKPIDPDTGPEETEQHAAHARAVQRFGDRAVVGHGLPVSSWTLGACYYVGWKEVGEWRWLGLGTTWNEAFANVRKVKTHYLNTLTFYE